MEFYLIGSLRNEKIPAYSSYFRSLGLEIFDSWFAAGPIADDSWQAYEKGKGIPYDDALKGYAAKHVFEFDKYHLNRVDGGILVLPAGKSGHLELGYLVGRGKPCYVLFDQEPERWDVMYQFADGVFFDKEKLGNQLKKELICHEESKRISCGPNARNTSLQFPGVYESSNRTPGEWVACVQPSGTRRETLWEKGVRLTNWFSSNGH